jgi:hypothetical protein
MIRVMRCGAFHRVEGTLCLVRHGQAALSGSKTKAPGFAGGYLQALQQNVDMTRDLEYPTLLPMDGPKGSSGLSFLIECHCSLTVHNPIVANALAAGGSLEETS